MRKTFNESVSRYYKIEIECVLGMLSRLKNSNDRNEIWFALSFCLGIVQFMRGAIGILQYDNPLLFFLILLLD